MSIGDDLEQLIEDIKLNDSQTFYNDRWQRSYCFNEYFQVSSLTNDEQKRLESNDISFKKLFFYEKPDVPKSIMLLSES